MINEIINLNSPVMVLDSSSNTEIQVAYLNATLDTGNQNFNISMSTTNKVLMIANAAIVKEQYTAFVAAVTAKAISLGYIIF